MINKILNMSDYLKKNISYPSDFGFRNISALKNDSTIVIGMRRLGKTEYLKYRYNLFENKDKVLFLDLDSSWLSTINFKNAESKTLQEFKDSLVHYINDNKIELLLIDEIQVMSEWSRFIQGLINDFKFLTVVATGSDALELNKTNGRGLGRFNIHLVGPLTFSEFTKMGFPSSNDKMKQLYDHLDNWAMPSQEMNNSVNLFRQVYEKQIDTSNFSKDNVLAVLRCISLHPGSGISFSNISKQIKEETDFSPDFTQVKNIISFLEESELIFKLKAVTSLTKVSKSYDAKYYPANWNLYKAFLPLASYSLLNEVDNPRKGFIFENYVVSNIISNFMTEQDRYNVFYGNDDKECDLVVSSVRYEIKSFDVLVSNDMRSIIEKAKKNETIIIHTGESKIFERVRLINVAEFLENKMWQHLKK